MTIFQTLNSIFSYLLQVNVTLTILFIFYKLFFDKDTFFGWRRFTLLGIALAALALPLIPQISFATPIVQPVDNFIATFALPEFSTNSRATFYFSPWVMIGKIVYLLIAALLMLRTLYSLASLTIRLMRARRVTVQGITVCQLSNDTPPFSFFKWICLPAEGLTDEQQSDILIHEQAHIKYLHSIDVVLFQLFVNLNWLNPIVWFMRREIRVNHEYQADEAVIHHGADKKSYQYLLINTTYPKLAAANLYNSFNVLPLKKRIMMLNKKRTKQSKVGKYLLFLPMIALSILVVNCTSKVEESTTDGTEMDELVVVGYGDGWKIVKEGEKTEAKMPSTLDGTPVFDTVEVMPEFPGGMQALMKYLAMNIKYPVKAQEAGTQGRVIVQFIVNKEGAVTDPTVARSVESSLDQEAIRIVKAMPAWTPGLQKGEPVNVKFTLPVMFKLTDND